MLITINRKCAFSGFTQVFQFQNRKKYYKSNFLKQIFSFCSLLNSEGPFLEVNFEEGLIAPFLTLFYIAFDQKRW